jgi:hypothetical protein
MITKIGFIILALIAWGSLFLLDYYLKQDQVESTRQLHDFVQQARDQEKARTTARKKFELQLLADYSHCEESAVKFHNAYVDLIREAAPIKQAAPIKREPAPVPGNILERANSLLSDKKTECKIIYDERLREG